MRSIWRRSQMFGEGGIQKRRCDVVDVSLRESALVPAKADMAALVANYISLFA